ncbi:class I SAM-dependent methyltransferase [archaeon]|nr:MAG: class I SAM-dependent methyltransferase [archaeon]
MIKGNLIYNSNKEIEKVSEIVLCRVAKYAAKNINDSDEVLDILTGYANFLVKLVKIKRIKAIGIDNSDFIIKIAKKNIGKNGLSKLIKIKKVDARKMPFQDNFFDAVVNYMGWGDVVLTCGKSGIKKIIKEAARALKPKGRIIISFPLIESNNKIEIMDEKIQIYLYGRKRHYSKEFFKEELRRNKIKIIDSKVFLYPNKRISPETAKSILVPHQKEVQKEFGIKSQSYGEIWKKFGSFIEKYGYGGGKGIVVLIGEKMKNI